MMQSSDQLLLAYRKMRTIREFEDRMHLEFTRGDVPGFVHLYAGQEASAVAVCANLTDRDVLLNTHRAHGPAIARGSDIYAVAKEIYCRQGGICRGRGGSAHLHDVSVGLWGANSGVGSGVALGCGAALAARNRGTGGIAVALAGDGAINQGVVSEALNMASIWKLPLVIVFENNGYAEATGADYAIAGKDIYKRAAAFDMPGIMVEGHDYFAVYDAVGKAVTRARSGDGPTIIEVKQLRYYGHFEGDAQSYRPRGEVEQYRQDKDCLKTFRSIFIAETPGNAAQLDAIDREVMSLIDDVYAQARAAAFPADDEFMHYIYASDCQES
ncbi:MAG: thiamine pyrophosphate-dependent dehydrogenase E1 component subunit alpha [Alphaproteobacteria bacterium]|nr:thiamine pyrophosphate-dependent dehydrogenase E1 component subunit alpha [Alphaproteobacteria bacterium]